MTDTMKNYFKKIVLILIVLMPVIAQANYPTPAPDRQAGESFVHWFCRAMINPF